MGVCNGFQLLIKLGLFGDNIKLSKNDSGRFESRFSKICVDYSDNDKFRTNAANIFFKNMSHTKYGMWVAHGEGKVEMNKMINSSNFVPILKYAGGFITNESDKDEPFQ